MIYGVTFDPIAQDISMVRTQHNLHPVILVNNSKDLTLKQEVILHDLPEVLQAEDWRLVTLPSYWVLLHLSDRKFGIVSRRTGKLRGSGDLTGAVDAEIISCMEFPRHLSLYNNGVVTCFVIHNPAAAFIAGFKHPVAKRELFDRNLLLLLFQYAGKVEIETQKKRKRDVLE